MDRDAKRKELDWVKYLLRLIIRGVLQNRRVEQMGCPPVTCHRRANALTVLAGCEETVAMEIECEPGDCA